MYSFYQLSICDLLLFSALHFSVYNPYPCSVEINAVFSFFFHRAELTTGAPNIRLQLGMFTVYPAVGSVQAGSSVQVTVDMIAENPGFSEEVGKIFPHARALPWDVSITLFVLRERDGF